MQPKSDAQLLRDYAADGADTAFAELVHRHTNLVYSAALRQVDSADLAAEISQRVFISLARDAQTLSPRLAPEASLAGWLCRCARNLAFNHRRDEFRRQTRERLAMDQFTSTPETAPDWEHLRGVLDDALAELDELDHDALVLRIFQQQDFRAVGAALGVSDDTAQKRVTRALEKLRDELARRGLRTTASALAIVITANAIQAAPAGLAATISAAVLLTGSTVSAAAISTTTVIAATKTIAMTTLQKALVTAALATAVGASIYEARQAAQLRAQNQTLQQQQTGLAAQIEQLQHERDAARNQLTDRQVENSEQKRNAQQQELLQLRGQVTLLRNELARVTATNQVTTSNADALSDDPPYKRHAKLLMSYFEAHPDAQIPEMKLLLKNPIYIASVYGLAVKLAAYNDQANYGKQGFFDENRIKLETDQEYRRAASELRSYAECSVAPLICDALKAYLQANNGTYPKSAAELQACLSHPMEEAILQRYEIQPYSNFPKIKAKYATSSQLSELVITPKTAVDEEFDHRILIGPGQYRVGDPGSYKP